MINGTQHGLKRENYDEEMRNMMKITCGICWRTM